MNNDFKDKEPKEIVAKIIYFGEGVKIEDPKSDRDALVELAKYTIYLIKERDKRQGCDKFG